MRIISLELVKYKRMMLNNIDTFTIRPAAMVQLILGTNGSGKSSLIKELTPLPADPSDYMKGGSKTIRIFDKGNNYLLKNSFNQKNEHSFEMNGEELNPGGTITVQKELVRQYFHVTNEIHELLTGLESFTEMSPSRRREWLTQLSDISYDYALGVFARLKERSRDYTGALRTAKKRLVAETTKVVTGAEESKLRADMEVTLKELRLLQEQSAPLDRPVADYERDEQAGLEELSRMSNRLLRMRFVAPYGTASYGVDPTKPVERDEWGATIQPAFKSVEEIENYLNLVRHDITATEALINKAVSEHSKIDETVKVLMRTGEEGVKSLQNRLNGLRESKAELLAQRKLKIEGFDSVNALSALDSVHDTLSCTFSTIPENEDKRFSAIRLKALQDVDLQAKETLRKMQVGLAERVSRKTHMEAHKANGSLDCPKCHHRWVAGFSDEKYNELLLLIAEREEEIKVVEKTLLDNTAAIVEIQQYGELYRDYTRCVNNWPVLRPFWNYLQEGEYVTRSPRKVLSVLDALRFDLGLENNAVKLDVEMQEVKNLIISAEQVGDANLLDQRQKLDEVSHGIDQMTVRLTQLQGCVAEYSQYKRQLVEALDLSNRITALTTSLQKNNADMIEMMRRETMSHCMRQLQLALASKQETLSAIELKKGIIKDLEDQIGVLTIQEEAAKILVRELSPTDGLIAENLLGFIRNFVGQMNALVRRIWSYPLQVMDCGVSGASGAELDYRFPLLVQTRDNIVADVKLGSSGMKEIVNLAFKVVAMRYLGLDESPLFLDEFGASFDEAHRNTATTTIKNLMDTQKFTQLFMVSHYASSHGAFTNAEICVLCESNITVPLESSYNKHVTITH